MPEKIEVPKELLERIYECLSERQTYEDDYNDDEVIGLSLEVYCILHPLGESNA